ncbi:hypothetical protein [Streptomyces enissocaesilis]|uniref:Uncharacterized protein n=1 Tax=Streptomyces enissocaesilis TaxID=332589 RepID=A0ABP6JDI7_9ACTN
MIIVYTPEGGEPEHYDARSLLASEASIVARTIDQTWPQIKEGLPDEDLDAMRGVVWVLKKRHQPTLRFGDFDPGVEEMVTRCDQREITDWVTGAFAIREKEPDVTTEQIVQALREVPAAAVDPAHAEALIKELAEGPKGLAPETGPEAESMSATLTSSESSTSDSSLTSSTSTPTESTA